MSQECEAGAQTAPTTLSTAGTVEKCCPRFAGTLKGCTIVEIPSGDLLERRVPSHHRGADRAGVRPEEAPNDPAALKRRHKGSKRGLALHAIDEKIVGREDRAAEDDQLDVEQVDDVCDGHA